MAAAATAEVLLQSFPRPLLRVVGNGNAEILPVESSQPTHLVENGTSEESYWKSTRQNKILGGFVVRQALETPEGMNARDEAFADFATGVQENLATDKEYGEILSFEPMREMKIQGRHVVNQNGEPVVSLVKRGWEQSRKLAEESEDSPYHVQATRDEGDFMVANIVDNLEEGEMYALVSMDPKEAMAQNKEFWESVMHYEEGMAVVQVYYRKDKDTLMAGAYSVKQSDKKAFAKILQSHGRHIDPDTHSDLWSRYGIRKRVSLEEAQTFGIEMREAHRREIKEATSLVSVTELMKRHSSLVTTYFDTYIIPLAEATVTGRNNKTMQGLAETLLNQAHVFKPEVVRSLIKITNSKSFDDTDARFMEETIRYALVEDLRTYLVAHVKGVSQNDTFAPDETQINPQMLNARVSQNVVTGTLAERSYRGCASSGGMGRETRPNADVPDSRLPGSPQDIFGGKANEKENANEHDKYGSLKFECPRGHENTRPRNKLIPKCKKCGISVKCEE